MSSVDDMLYASPSLCDIGACAQGEVAAGKSNANGDGDGDRASSFQ